MMKNWSTFIGRIFCVLLIVTIACSQDEDFFGNEISGEDIDPHSFFYDRNSKRVIEDTDLVITQEISKDRYDGKSSRNFQTTDQKVLSERIFYKRLINLLLSNIDIEIKNDELITGTLGIEISHSQMEILQNFDIQKMSLRKIDAILSEVIQKPPHRYMPHVMYTIDALCNIYMKLLRVMNENLDATVVVFVIIASFFLMRKLNLRRGIPIFILIQMILVLSFFMTWWNLIQEAEIKLMAAQMQFSEIPIACQPDKMNIWHKMMSFVTSNDDCEKYYKTMMSNPKLQVTPAIALTHLVSTVILHPITHVGTTISSFIENATESLPWMYGWIIKLLLYLSVALLIIILPFCMSGASFKMGFGPLFHFGIHYGKKERKGNSLKNTEKREPIEIIRQEHHSVYETTTKALEAGDLKALTGDNNEEGCTDKEDEAQDVVQDFFSEDTVPNKKSTEIDDETNEIHLTSKELKKVQDGSGDC